MVLAALAPTGAWPHAGPSVTRPRAAAVTAVPAPFAEPAQPCSRHGAAAVPLGLALGCTAAALAPRRRRTNVRGRRVLLRAADDAYEPDYGSKEYWDNRYEADKGGKTFDWIGDYDRYKPFIEKAMADLGLDKKTARILDLGCGNAKLAEDMYDDGYRGITGLDISEVVIDEMKRRNAEKRPELTWVVGSAFELPFEDQSFDIVIDKSTTDAVSCDEDHRYSNLVRMSGQVTRVLPSDGKYLIFSGVRNMPRTMLSMSHLKFDWAETELDIPFCELSAFVATKAVGAEVALMRFYDQLEYAEMVDREQKEAREKQAEADQRLKDQAPSSFGVLD